MLTGNNDRVNVALLFISSTRPKSSNHPTQEKMKCQPILQIRLYCFFLFVSSRVNRFKMRARRLPKNGWRVALSFTNKITDDFIFCTLQRIMSESDNFRHSQDR